MDAKNVKSAKIIIGGPPHSGKSCLRYGLKEAIRSLHPEIYPYVVTVNPDGEGAWYQKTSCRDPESANELKDQAKRDFSDGRVALYSQWVELCEHPMILFDSGGLPSQENKKICAPANYAILLAGDMSALDEWRAFCQELKLDIIAELHSDYSASVDSALFRRGDGVYSGSVHYLERGDETVRARPTVLELAEVLVRRFGHLFPIPPDFTGENTMAAFFVTLDGEDILRLAFGEPADNDEITRTVEQQVRELIKSGKLTGGEVLRINGPVTVPAAMVVAHGVGHLYQAIACFDPKIGKYVVVIAHSEKYHVGDLLG